MKVAGFPCPASSPLHPRNAKPVRGVAPQPLPQKMRPRPQRTQARRLGLVLVAEGVVGNLDLDLDLLRLGLGRVVKPGRHAVDLARVLRLELEAGDPRALLDAGVDREARRGSSRIDFSYRLGFKRAHSPVSRPVT